LRIYTKLSLKNTLFIKRGLTGGLKRFRFIESFLPNPDGIENGIRVLHSCLARGAAGETVGCDKVSIENNALQLGKPSVGKTQRPPHWLGQNIASRKSTGASADGEQSWH
jgi:hypothetical protein